jgi:hypothetical protein
MDLRALFPVPEHIGDQYAFWCGCLEAKLTEANEMIADLRTENEDLHAQLEERGSYAEV